VDSTGLIRDRQLDSLTTGQGRYDVETKKAEEEEEEEEEAAAAERLL
jgi:hypothetical protein